MLVSNGKNVTFREDVVHYIYFTGKFSDPELKELEERYNLDDDHDEAVHVFKDFGHDLMFEVGYKSHVFVDGKYEVTYGIETGDLEDVVRSLQRACELRRLQG